MPVPAHTRQRRERSRFCGAALLCLALTAAGCLAPKYSTARDVSPDAGVDLGPSNPGPINLRYCDPFPALAPASNPPPDWTCARETLAGVPAPRVSITGTFYDPNVDHLEYCSPALHSCLAVPFDPGSMSFAFPSNQIGNGIVYWRRDGALYSATFWHSLTAAVELNVGSFWLFTRDEAKKYVPNLPLPDGQGVAIIGLRDCSGLSAAGARFAAISAANQVMGNHFSLNKATMKPQMIPTDVVGTGGLINLDPGSATFYAYVADGCIVAEATVVVEADRVAYVFLVPNGFN